MVPPPRIGHTGAVPPGWQDADHARSYLARADRLPHRDEGEAVLVGDLDGCLPGRLLDLGCGDGRLAAAVRRAYPGCPTVCVDVSETMLAEAARRFRDDEPPVTVVRQDLAGPFPAGPPFDRPFNAVVSSFAVHHVEDERKRTLAAELAGMLAPGGVLANLDVVASPTSSLHRRWRQEMGVEDDPADRLCDLSSQLAWMTEAGLEDVDCIWKWRGLALLRGRKP